MNGLLMPLLIFSEHQLGMYFLLLFHFVTLSNAARLAELKTMLSCNQVYERSVEKGLYFDSYEECGPTPVHY